MLMLIYFASSLPSLFAFRFIDFYLFCLDIRQSAATAIALLICFRLTHDLRMPADITHNTIYGIKLPGKNETATIQRSHTNVYKFLSLSIKSIEQHFH